MNYYMLLQSKQINLLFIVHLQTVSFVRASMVISEKPPRARGRVGVLVVPFPHMLVDGICDVAFFPLKKFNSKHYLFISKKMPSPSISSKWFWTVQIVLIRFKLDFSGLFFIILTRPKQIGTGPKWFGRSKIILDP